MSETLSESADEAKPEGAWFVYGWDCGAYPLGLHTDELEARRMADNFGYPVSVVFWPNGQEWDGVQR